jgi:hypothetical protein
MEMALSLRNSRTYGVNLVMPQNYVSLDNDEMEYMDGGTRVFTLSYEQIAVICGGILLGAAEAGPVAMGAAITAVASALGGPAGTVAGIIASAIGVVGLSSLCYLVLQTQVTHKSLYMDVSMNWIFPNISFGLC